MLRDNSEFSMSIMKLSCKELGDANQYILDIAQKNVRERLAEILLHLNNSFGTNEKGELNIFLTREELAGIVGTATESVIRLLSEFKKDNLLELNKRKIKLIDIQSLKRIAQEY
jgi:CRP-like cAMP-binding protein